MLFILNKPTPYKVTSVSADENSIVFRIFTPTMCLMQPTHMSTVLSTASVKNLCISQGEQSYCCGHECMLTRDHPLWKAGNHLVIYTTPDLYVNNIIGVARKQDIHHLAALTVLGEILCAEINQKFTDADILVYTDPKGILFTELASTPYANSEPFGFITSAYLPKRVKTNEMFSFTLSLKTPSDKPLSGEKELTIISGYIPNTRVNFIEGKAEVTGCALMVTDQVIIKMDDLELTIGINNG